MSTAVLDDDSHDPFERRRRKRMPRWTAPAVLGLIVIGVVAVYFLRAPTIGERGVEHKILNVVLPPPPPPPPPKVKPPEPKPPEPKPPEPKRPKVIEQPKPQEAPPPPPTAAPTPTNDGLTAREGNGPTNYGLSAGDGSGLRIGGGHGNGFAAYGQLVYADVLRAVQSDPALTKGKFSIRFQVTVAPDGRIEAVKVESSSGDSRLDAALEQLLTRLTLSQHPPGGLPPVRIELNSRPSL